MKNQILDSLNRPLTEYEMKLMRVKCIHWSYSNNVTAGLIELGNGEGDVTAYLPYDILMRNDVSIIGMEHVLPINCPDDQIGKGTRLKLWRTVMFLWIRVPLRVQKRLLLIHRRR